MRTQHRTTIVAVAVSVLVFATFTLQAANEASSVTPDQALTVLKEGNARYVEARTTSPRRDAARRTETVKNGQRPVATVIACSDSREPVEILFDQGIGDVFVIRVAGAAGKVALRFRR